MKRLKVTEKDFRIVDAPVSFSAAVITDLHDTYDPQLLTIIKNRMPDAVFIVGDFVDRSSLGLNASAVELLKDFAKISTVFYSFGNHERVLMDSDIELIKAIGVNVLDNTYIAWNGILIGGLSSEARKNVTDEDRMVFIKRTINRRKMRFLACIADRRKDQNYELFHRQSQPELRWLDEFEMSGKYKILLAHHTEVYKPYLYKRKFNLILSGHAHGGQIRLFGKGLFAPGQGWLPQYTSGIYDDTLIVSRGAADIKTRIPRICNKPELIFLKFESRT